MAFLEAADYCSIEEYNDHRESRILEAALEVDGLYTYMMRLKDSEKQAALQAVRVMAIRQKSGFVAVKFAFLDEDLEPDFISAEPMHQGIIREFKGIGSFVDPDTNKKIALQEAYLRDYFEGQFGNFLVEASELGLTGNIA